VKYLCFFCVSTKNYYVRHLKYILKQKRIKGQFENIRQYFTLLFIPRILLSYYSKDLQQYAPHNNYKWLCEKFRFIKCMVHIVANF